MYGLNDDEDAAQALALADEHDKAAVPGLEGINVDQISQDVAAAGQPPPVVPGQPAANPPLAAGPETPPSPPQLAPATPQPETQQPPTDVETAKAAQDVGAPPPRPKLTGDQTKDVQSNLEWSRQLTDYQTALERKSGEIAKRDAEVNSKRAEKEAEAERIAAGQREAEVHAYQQQRAQRQQAIDASVAEKAAAYQDLKGGEKRSFGDRIGDAISIALGSVGQGLMLAGHVAGAKNEGLEAVNRMVDADYKRRLERVKLASDAVLEARYQLKDAGDNHRAALADADADRAAKYRLIAAEAAQQLKAQGASDQDVKTNLVVVHALQEAAKSEDAIHAREEATQVHRETAAATNQLASAHLNLAERTAGNAEADRRSTMFEHRREFNAQDEERRQRMAAAEAARAEKAKENADKATVGSVRQNAVLGNLAEAEKAVKDVGEVPVETINQLQTNREQAKATEHSATSGVFGNIGARIARGTGLAARGPYTDIPEDQQKKITAAEQVITHLTEMQQGKNLETLEQYRDRYSPYVPGLSEQEVRRREKALPGLVSEQRAIQDPKGTGAKRTAAAEGKTAGEPSKDTGHAGGNRPTVMRIGKVEFHLQPDGTYK